LTVDEATAPPPYKPCQFLDFRGALEQVLTRQRP
jgi:hypothetical protein